MRLRVCIERHALPPVKILVQAPVQQPATVSTLLEQVNVLVPLESDGWGLEDYSVTVDGYECVHFADVHSLLSENDQVRIRALQSSDIKTRLVSGRMQISNNGVHLIDGIPFGREALRRPHRPPVYIPPLKRRRLLTDYDEDDGLEDEPAEWDFPEEHFEEDNEFDEEASEGSQLKITAGNQDDIEEDADNNPARSRKSSQKVTGQMGSHLVTNKRNVMFADDVAPGDGWDIGNPLETNGDGEDEEEDEDFAPDDESGSGSESGEDSDTESSAADSENDSEAESISAQLRLFQTKRPHTTNNGMRAKSNSKEDGASQSESSDYVSSSSDSSSDDTDTDQQDTQSNRKAPQGKTQHKPIAKQTNPVKKVQQQVSASLSGQGKKDTQERNKRRAARKRLDFLKRRGRLAENANLADLRLHEAFERGEIPSKLDVYERYLDTDTLNTLDSSIDVAGELGMVAETIAAAQDDDGPPEELSTTLLGSGVEQPRLDVQSSRRLLFGSLGFKAPRNKEEETALRAKMNGSSAAGLKSKGKTQPRPTSREDEDKDKDKDEKEVANDLGDGWKDKINLVAVECVQEGMVLSAPPFPFYQRWDPQQQHRGQKRKRSPLLDGQNEEEEEWAGLEYDDVTEGKSDTTKRDESPDLIELPQDLANHKSLEAGDCMTGATIAFTRMEVSEATSWQPAISPMRVAKVDSFEGEVLSLTLAKRDRAVTKYDENGNRIFGRFESTAEIEDEGLLEVYFGELTQAFLLQPAPTTVLVPDSVPLEDGSSDAVSPEQSPQKESDESQELQAAQHQMPIASASEDSSIKLIEASA